MQLPRSIGLIDLGVATVVLVMLVLPPREMHASAAYKGDEAARFQLALSEARTIAYPTDGDRVSDLVRLLGDGGFKDWALEAAVRGSARTKMSPTHWRALLAASLAHTDRLEVVEALDYANRALIACRASRESCPSWEEIKVEIYQQHLDAGVKSGIDPRLDPKGFRDASQRTIRNIRLNKSDAEQGGNAPGR